MSNRDGDRRSPSTDLNSDIGHSLFLAGYSAAMLERGAQ